MAGFNRVIMMGNLTRDPEYKQLNSGQALCRLGIASNRQYRNRQSGEMVQEVCFVDVDVWGQQAESCRQYLSKGRAVLIEGRLKLDTWQDNDGKNRSKHTIVADRVVFVSGPSAQDSTDTSVSDDDARVKSQEEVLAHVKNIAAGSYAGAVKEEPVKEHKAKKKKADELGAPAVMDEPPFQDDLPF